jgi:hypothetical protein
VTSHPSTAAPILAVLAVVLVTLGAYVGGYLSLVRKTNEAGDWTFANDSPYDWTCAPLYRIGGRLARAFFGPAHSVDLQLRPEYWTVQLPPLSGSPVVDPEA